MSYMRFNYHSETLGKYVDVSVVLPTDKYTAYSENDRQPRFQMMPKDRPHFTPGMKFQTIYLLHGGGDDDSLPYRYTNIERYANDNNVMVVTPDISNSFGADTEYGIDYGMFVTDELPRVVQTLFPSSPERQDNFIIGFAMGGAASLSCGIRAPENYAWCVDISGGIGYTLCPEKLEEEMNEDFLPSHFPVYAATFGKNVVGTKHDLRRVLQQKIDEKAELPQFMIIHGDKEGFIGDRIDGDIAAMKEMGIDPHAKIYHGFGHNFEMWDLCLKDLLYKDLPLKRWQKD